MKTDLISLQNKMHEHIQIPSSQLLQTYLGFNNEVLSLSTISQEWLKNLLQMSKITYKILQRLFGIISPRTLIHFPIILQCLFMENYIVYIAQKSITHLQIHRDLQIFDPKINGIKIHLKMEKSGYVWISGI